MVTKVGWIIGTGLAIAVVSGEVAIAMNEPSEVIQIAAAFRQVPASQGQGANITIPTLEVSPCVGIDCIFYSNRREDSTNSSG